MATKAPQQTTGFTERFRFRCRKRIKRMGKRLIRNLSGFLASKIPVEDTPALNARFKAAIKRVESMADNIDGKNNMCLFGFCGSR